MTVGGEGGRRAKGGDLLPDSTWEVPDVYIMQDRLPKIVLAPGAGFPLRNDFAEHFWSSRDRIATPLVTGATGQKRHYTRQHLAYVNTSICSRRPSRPLPTVVSRPSLPASLHDVAPSIHVELRYFSFVNFEPIQRSSGPVPR